MSKFIGGVVGGAIPIIVGVIATFAAPAAGSPSCMTQEEARTAFPRDHIYWHGPQRCWDNVGKQRSQTPAANGNAAGSAAKRSDVNPPPAPSAKQQSAAPPSEPAGDKPAEPVVVPPVRFVDDALLRGLSWPVPNGPANDWWARAQQAEPLPSPPPKNPARNRRAGRRAWQSRLFAGTLLLAAAGAQRRAPDRNVAPHGHRLRGRRRIGDRALAVCLSPPATGAPARAGANARPSYRGSNRFALVAGAARSARRLTAVSAPVMRGASRLLPANDGLANAAAHFA